MRTRTLQIAEVEPGTGQELVLTGWGATNDQNPVPSTQLRYARVAVSNTVVGYLRAYQRAGLAAAEDAADEAEDDGQTPPGAGEGIAGQGSGFPGGLPPLKRPSPQSVNL